LRELYERKTMGDVTISVPELECRLLLAAFMVDCNSVGPESAGANLQVSMKSLLNRMKYGLLKTELSENEIEDGFFKISDTFEYDYSYFRAGVRFAEQQRVKNLE
jgi:predicted SAM-dependent methyltransferase